MPILPQDETVPNYGGPATPTFAPQPQKKGPTFMEGLGAVFEEGNTVGSTLKFFEYEKLMRREDVDPSYNVWSDIAGYEDHADAFVHSWNPHDTAIIKRRIDDEKATREQISRAGGWGIAGSILAGVLDPINLVPVGGQAMRAKSFGEGLKTGLEVGFKSSLLTEGILQATQVDRSAVDSALNLGTGTIFGGLVGGVGGGISGRVAGKDARLVERLDAEFKDALANAPVVDAGGLSAQSVRAGTADQVGLAGSVNVAELEARNPLSDNPLLRGLTSPSTETNRIISELADVPYYLKGNAEDVASPIAAESLMKGWQGPLADSILNMDEMFAQYRMGRPKRVGDQLRAGIEDLTGSPKLSYQAFKEEVGKAMRRNDQHPVPEVARAAKAYRERLVDPLKDDAIKLGLLPEGVEPIGAASYLTRVYNIPKILERRNEFTDHLTNWFEVSQPRGDKALTRAELRSEAEEVVAQILGQSPARTGYDLVANLRGPLKERTLNVPDDVLEPWLENDVERVMRIYTRTMSADVELARAFGRPDMSDQIANVKVSYDKLFRRMPDGPKQKALSERLARDVKDIEAVRDRIRGQYALPKDPNGIGWRTLRAMRTLNYLRLLGGMTVSAIPDLARVVLAGGGLGKTMTRGLAPMIGNLKGFKMAAAEVRMAGTALDMVLDTRAQQMVDIFDDFGRNSKFERGLQYAGEKFGIVSIMSPWNAAMKQFAGVMIQARMLRAITEGIAEAPVPPNTFKTAKGSVYRIEPDGTTIRDKAYRPEHGALDKGIKPKTDKTFYLDMDGARALAPPQGSWRVFVHEDGTVSLITKNDDGRWGVGPTSKNIPASTEPGIGKVPLELWKVDPDVKGPKGTAYRVAHFGNKIVEMGGGAPSPRTAAVPTAELKRLRFLGIDRDMARRIAGEFNKHGEKGGGVWTANTADWTDIEAARAYRAALVKEVDSHIVSPGQEKPLWMSTELGKTIGQFKSYQFSAMSRQLIRGLQERDAAVAQSVVLGVALGMLSYYLKTKAAGKEPSAEPQKWVIEGLDRSGTLGWVMEANNMLEKVSRNRLGINPALGVDPAGRYVSRSPLEAMLGPSAGLVNDAWNVAGATSAAVVPDENGETKPLSRADIHKARRLVPFQNTFYLNWLFNSGEDAAGDAMGLEEKPQ